LSRKKGIMATRWRPPRRRGRDASCSSINQTRKRITQQGKRGKWSINQTGNQLFIKENGKMVAR
jgi:hypothetical protein